MEQVSGTAELELLAPSTVLLKLDEPVTIIAKKTLTTVQCMPGLSTFPKLSPVRFTNDILEPALPVHKIQSLNCRELGKPISKHSHD